MVMGALGLTKLALLLWVSVVVGSALPRVHRSARIIGGSDASIQQFPYQLSLRVSGRHWCGASVIGQRVALTAAHCFLKASGPSDVTLRGGSSLYSSGGTLFEVQSYYTHPNFNAQNGQYDVALLFTKSDLSGQNIKSISISKSGAAIPVGSQATISGWGLTDASSSVNPLNLQYTTVKIISQSVCDKSYAAYGGVDDVFFCATDNGRDSCQGDSGGPIVYQNVQIGVVAGGIGCAHPDFPGLYTRLSDTSIQNWIQKTVGQLKK